MTETVIRHIIPAALELLPPALDTPDARAMILATGLQESKFLHRRQLPRVPGGRSGPARGLWQFERNGGIKGVSTHPKTRELLAVALRELRYAGAIGNLDALHIIVEHNDVVACIFARLNLWWLPSKLPTRDNPREGWRQYLEAWRPGDPHPDTWNSYFRDAWAVVDNEE